MEELLKYYGKKFDKNRIVMIGYSLGAEIVPFIVSRFSADLKSEVKSVVLLSPETKTDFEIHISNMLGMGNSSNTYDVLGEIFKIDTLPVLIIFGSGEKSKIPALLKETRVTVRIIPGDHHYKFDLPLIIQTMRDNKVF